MQSSIQFPNKAITAKCIFSACHGSRTFIQVPHEPYSSSK